MIYEFFRWVALISAIPFQLVFFKRKTYYEKGAPRRPFKKGGALIIMNHYSFWDFFMSLFIVIPRKLNVVSSEAPFKSRALRFGMRFFGVIQANRITKNMRFMDECADVIRRGQIVQIFPEARITTDGEMHEFKHSYLVIAHRANAPIIPFVTDGNYGLFKRAHVIIGAPIDLSNYISSTGRTPTRAELTAANDVIYGKMRELRAELEVRKSEKRNGKKKRS